MRLRLLLKRFAVRLAFLATVLFALGSFPHLVFSAMFDRGDHESAGQSEQDDDDDLDEEAIPSHTVRSTATREKSAPRRLIAARGRPSFAPVAAAIGRPLGRAPPRAIYKMLSRLRC